jgi:archaemetzincin
MRLLYAAVMGDIHTDVLNEVERALEDRFEATVRRLALDEPDFARDERRGQYGSVPVLRMLSEARPPDAWRLLGITSKDLFIPALTFVYGQAQMEGSTAVISLARLGQEFYGMPQDRPLAALRARKEALHEVGHTLGLIHCAERECVMALATNIRQLDAKSAEFCPACAAEVRGRLSHAGGG